MKEKIDIKKTISIPHLRACVHLVELDDVFQGSEQKGCAYTFIMNEDEKTIQLDIGIAIKEIEKSLIPENANILAHEFMHVIQILCEKRNMKINEEKEHTAFIMNYLMEKSLENLTKTK